MNIVEEQMHARAKALKLLCGENQLMEKTISYSMAVLCLRDDGNRCGWELFRILNILGIQSDY